MAIEDFRGVSQYFRDVETVVLEGWGEALLYAHLIEAIRLVKAAGSQAGFVTSGWGLTPEHTKEIIGAGIDFMGFSLSGATAETHNAIRIHSDFGGLIEAMRRLNQIKKEMKSGRPKLHIVFLMLRENFLELPLLPELAREVGAEEVACINLIQVANAWQESQRVFSCEPSEEVKLIEAAQERAKSLGIALRMAPLSPRQVAVCEENPLRNLYVSVTGEVAPCVYLYPPAPPPIHRIFCGAENDISKVSFGNIHVDPIARIWESERYRAFRGAFEARKRTTAQAYLSLLMSTERHRKPGTVSLPDPPEPCRTCHKILGL